MSAKGLLIFPLAGFACFLSAQTILNADFEQPTYQIGLLTGQDGWSNQGGGQEIASVSIGAGRDLTRGVSVSGVFGSMYERLVNGASFSNPILSTSADFRFSAVGFNTNFFGIWTDTGRGVYVRNGTQLEILGLTSGSNVTMTYPFAPDVYYNIGYDLNYTTGSIRVFVDGQTVYTGTGTGAVPTLVRVKGDGPMQFDNLRLVGIPGPPPPYTLNFSVFLFDVVPGTATTTLTYRVRQGGNVIYTSSASVGASGVLSTTIPSTITGAVHIEFDTPTHLVKRRNINLPPSSSNGGFVYMTNGDVDGSGEVDAADIDVVIAQFGTSQYPADLDLSGEVDAADIDITIANFGNVDE